MNLFSIVCSLVKPCAIYASVSFQVPLFLHWGDCESCDPGLHWFKRLIYKQWRPVPKDKHKASGILPMCATYPVVLHHLTHQRTRLSKVPPVCQTSGHSTPNLHWTNVPPSGLTAPGRGEGGHSRQQTHDEQWFWYGRFWDRLKRMDFSVNTDLESPLVDYFPPFSISEKWSIVIF